MPHGSSRSSAFSDVLSFAIATSHFLHGGVGPVRQRSWTQICDARLRSASLPLSEIGKTAFSYDVHPHWKLAPESGAGKPFHGFCAQRVRSVNHGLLSEASALQAYSTSGAHAFEMHWAQALSGR